MAERKWRERKQRVEEYERAKFERLHHSVCVACHEAGHYVVADTLGYPTYASINRNERNEARTWSFTEATPAGIADQVSILLAGEMAEMMLLGHGGLVLPNLQDLSLIFACSWMYTVLDRGIVVRMAQESLARVAQFYRDHPKRIPKFVLEAAQRLQDKAAPKAEKILNEQWSRVEEIARCLLEHKEIANHKLMTHLKTVHPDLQFVGANTKQRMEEAAEVAAA